MQYLSIVLDIELDIFFQTDLSIVTTLETIGTAWTYWIPNNKDEIISD